jgi:hypothetical protein
MAITSDDAILGHLNDIPQMGSSADTSRLELAKTWLSQLSA